MESKATQTVVISGLSLVILMLCHESAGVSEAGLKWGEKCTIPGLNQFLKPSEECEMSKGLTCQSYQQGTLCGCLIRSSLSFDEVSGECRRRPGHHCRYENTTSNPGASASWPYNHKCHARADCVVIEPLPENQKTGSKKPSSKDRVTVCQCKPTYQESRDGLTCISVNSVSTTHSNTLLVLLHILVLTFMTC